MIPRIKSVKPLKNYKLHVIFYDGRECLYDVGEDIETIKEYQDLKCIHGLFEQVQLDESRTCVFWNDFIDLPSDAIYENGTIMHGAIEASVRVAKTMEDEFKTGNTAIDGSVNMNEYDSSYWK